MQSQGSEPDQQSQPIQHNSLATPMADVPRLLRYRSSRYFILASVCLALLTDAFTYGAVNPIMPFILSDRLKIAEDQLQSWTSILFTVLGAGELVTAPICGWLADHAASRKVPFLFGLVLQGGAIALFGISTSLWMLVLSRILSGMSSAIVYTVGLALVIDTVGSDEVGQWMGTALSVSNVGIVISPVVGGGIYAKANVWGVLGFLIGLIILDIVLRLLMIEQQVANQYYHGSPSTPSIAHNTFQLSEPPSAGTAAPTALHDNSLDNQRGLRKKMRLPTIFRLLMSSRILSAWYGVFTQVSLLISLEAVLPLFVQRTFGWTSVGAGLIFLALGLPSAFGFLVGKVSDRFGPRPIVLVGCILTTPPLILLRFVTHDSTEQKVLLCVLLVLIGFFSNFVLTPLSAEISGAVDQIEAANPGFSGKKGVYAQATSLFEIAIAAAALVGPQVSGQAMQHLGWDNTVLILGVWFASVALPVIFFTGTRI